MAKKATPTEWQGQVRNGTIALPRSFFAWARENEGARVRVQAMLPPSRNVRGYFEGALVPAFCAWHDALNHRNEGHRRFVREWLKMRFLGRPRKDPITGETIVLAPSLAKLNAAQFREFVQQVVDYFTEQGIPVPNPDLYKKWAQVAVESNETFWEFLERTGLAPDALPPSEEDLYRMANVVR